jgi:hypothetical protein
MLAAPNAESLGSPFARALRARLPTGGAIRDQYRELSQRPIGRDEPEFENGRPCSRGER